MALILTIKRQSLVDHLLDDRLLRTHLRRSSRQLIDSELVVGVNADDFLDRMMASGDPHRFVATALVSDDEALVTAAQPWALAPERLPLALSPADSSRQQPSQHSPAVGRPADGNVGGSALEEAGIPGVDPLQPADPLSTITPELVAARDDSDSLGDEELAAECDRLRSRVTQLEAEVIKLKAQVPTRRDRRRQRKQESELKRTAQLGAAAVGELSALRSERDELVQIRKELEDQLEEANSARSVALRKSQQLERQLATPEGRAEYLRRIVDKELADIRLTAESLPYGQERSNATRRVDVLQRLGTTLNEAFPDEAELLPRARRIEVGRSYDFVVTPVGGGNEIGGSAILVEAADVRILVDAGTHPDGRGPARISDVIAGGRIDALVVTHAHNDHAGYVPALVNRFPNTKVICSEATAQLLPTMWADAAFIMERKFSEAEEGAVAPTPHYGQAEVELAESRITDRPYHRRLKVGDLGLTLFPAGHILGAAGVVIEGGNRRVVVTGDISGPDDQYLSVEPAHLPEGLLRGADLLVIETTYCHEEHRSRSLQEEGLTKAVLSVVERGGRVLIPAFGLGRAQEVVLILTRSLPEIDIRIDGLAKDISNLYEIIGGKSGRPLSILGGRVRPVLNRAREIRGFHSGVIVASSGMLTGGPSVAWAQSILPDDRAALLLCGFQDEEAPGRQLERLTDGFGAPKLRLPDQDLGWIDVDVRAQVRKYALSAHADRRGLLDIIERVRPKDTMLVHGVPSNQAVFRALLEQKGIRTVPTDRWTSCRT